MHSPFSIFCDGYILLLSAIIFVAKAQSRIQTQLYKRKGCFRKDCCYSALFFIIEITMQVGLTGLLTDL